MDTFDILTVLGVGLAMLAVWFFRWRRHARRSANESGYIPPNTSFAAQAVFATLTRIVAFVTAGPLNVIGHSVPKKGRIVLVANHQFLSDASVLRSVAGRHFRALGDAAHFPGFLGLICLWLGVVTFNFKTKEARAAGEQAGVKIIAAKRKFWHIRWNAGLIGVLSLVLSGVFLICLGQGETEGAILCLLAFGFFVSRSGGDACLGIAPQGALMPDNVFKPEEFRAGCVRAAKAAAVVSGEPVYIVPMSFHYSQDPRDAHWSQRFFNKTRSMFLGLRNPKHWDPIFKLDLETLGETERAEVEAERTRKWEEYKRSHVTLYRVTVAVGEPVDVSTLPEDPKEGIEQIRQKMLGLLEEAKAA
ncbi:MAG: 1-acyl-sn-glycerol-3-phosphate acyltransferase [Candidatus Obscuribacterales bacterium]|jgi:1-acyl-sn-glycerol-3-phosphate acyltransferase|nr:1-acyl-sn-glycerol-3-phosphate acyltransferase [Candidatus Obscuribacterales bacterium]